jgi:esterase/lipase
MSVLIAFAILVGVFDSGMAVWSISEQRNAIDTQNEWLIKEQILEADSSALNKTIILVHGFAGSPFDYKPIAQQLCDAGFRVVIPVIPGQGREELSFKRGKKEPEFYVDWLRDIVINETDKNGEKPYLMGFSMGGTLATIIASEDLVDRLVLLAPYYELPTANGFICGGSWVLKFIAPVVPKAGRGKINSKEGYREYTPGTFIISLPAFEKLQDLAKLAVEKVDLVAIPTFIATSKGDVTASFQRTTELYSDKSNVTILELEKSNHILLYDYDRNLVIESVLNFVTELN